MPAQLIVPSALIPWRNCPEGHVPDGAVPHVHENHGILSLSQLIALLAIVLFVIAHVAILILVILPSWSLIPDISPLPISEPYTGPCVIYPLLLRFNTPVAVPI